MVVFRETEHQSTSPDNKECFPLFALDILRGKRGDGSMVSSLDLGPEEREFEPWPVHPRCVLRQNTSNCHSASSIHSGI